MLYQRQCCTVREVTSDTAKTFLYEHGRRARVVTGTVAFCSEFYQFMSIDSFVTVSYIF